MIAWATLPAGTFQMGCATDNRRCDGDEFPSHAVTFSRPFELMTTEVTVQFEDIDGRTKMIMTHAGVPADSPGGAGWTMAIDKLAARVEAHATG